MRVSFPVLLVGILVTATVLLLVRPRPSPWAEAPQVAEPVPERSPFLRWRPLLCVVGAAGAWAMVGGRFGPVAAVVGAIAVWVVLGRSEDPALARRRERLAEDLPVGVDLLGSCLDSGAALEPALLAVADALEGPVAEEFRAIHHRLAIGVAPAEVWRGVARDPQLGPLGRAAGRAHETGASVGVAVRHLAEELRDRARSEVEARARSIEVKAAAPLGLCLLPAFMLLGVVPLVAGIFSSMSLFR